MNTVLGQPISPISSQEITVPTGAKFLSVGVRNGDIWVWYEADDSAESELRTLLAIRTYRPSNTRIQSRFLGTVEALSRDWHIYEW